MSAVTRISKMKIDYLENHADLIPTIAEWIFQEWGHLVPNGSAARAEASLRKVRTDGPLPVSVVALEGSEPVGIARLVECDMRTRRDLTPWLASVFVSADHRNGGIGTALCGRGP